MDQLPVGRLERDWRRMHADPALRARLRDWQQPEPALRGLRTPGDVVRLLQASGSAERKDQVLLALARQATLDPLAARVALHALLPGMKEIAGRMLLDRHEREEVWSALLAAAWERIRQYPVERRPRRVAANVLLDCMSDALTELARDRVDRALTSEPVPIDLVAGRDADLDIDQLLARAVAAKAITERDARLIARTRIDGVPLCLQAKRMRADYHALVVRRRRAERRLIRHLEKSDVTFGESFRPSCGARVSGRGHCGPWPADLTTPTPRREVNRARTPQPGPEHQ
jgi:hypothetical protein